MEKRYMFDYTCTILESVSFDSYLFTKEFEKAMQNLLPYDTEKLIEWVDEYVKQKPELMETLEMVE